MFLRCTRFIPFCPVIIRSIPKILRTFAAPTRIRMFRIKEYGRMELAQLYCPDITPESAWKKLKTWIELSPGLADRLRALGYDGHTRSFTPAQVRAIVDGIGEP